jgi:hypothetical protein
MTILDDLRAAIEATKPIVYYATEDTLPRGKVMRCTGVFGFPDWWMFNPEDLGELATHCRLIHIRDWVPTPEAIDRAFLDLRDSLPPIFGAHSWRDAETGKERR